MFLKRSLPEQSSLKEFYAWIKLRLSKQWEFRKKEFTLILCYGYVVKLSDINWTNDSKGFCYCRLLDPKHLVRRYCVQLYYLHTSNLADNFDPYNGAITADDTWFFFPTIKEALGYKLAWVDLKEPTTWANVLDEAEKHALKSSIVVNGNRSIVSYMSDVKDVLLLRDLKNRLLLH
ncbi:hypothetical protein POM88_029037 [Heracleum sosnowskyi]|uniref:Peptidase S9A N-terminal domain-containing protein n=1 Tax=Heracleum sosnowskyi TaxID=360622 RepID=A0AAD8MEI2_9APIA|nr:hypothetical protein POM88_029033 [Heracleum sosnowskyi]KAK1372844.1 hypothetical protein POM88_029037 [Heracleum sosnowskyi]